MRLSRCPACLDEGMSELVHWESVPTNTAFFFATAADARAHPRGSFRLTRCDRCGFLFNADHDPRLTEYSARCIETQSHSDHHSEFARSLAEGWIERHELRGRPALEVGTGPEADFLRLFCELSGGDGVGIDPAAATGRLSQNVSLISGLFDDSSATIPGDALICRHTLEHISDVNGFIRSLRLWAERHPSAAVLIEVPDTHRVLAEVAFWDLVYEHCSYFTPETLASTFSAAGFHVERCGLAYDDQYVILEARLAATATEISEFDLAHIAEQMREESNRFVLDLDAVISHFEKNLAELADDGPVLFWQAGAKATGMFAVCSIDDKVEALVDINPAKWGLHLVGSGHRIISPDEVAQYAPRHIVMMNPVYESEVAASLQARKIDAELHSAYELTVTDIRRLASGGPSRATQRPNGGRIL